MRPKRLRRVDLPEPEGPEIAINWEAEIERFRFLIAKIFSFPNV
jgi:hypothetical protein